LVASVNRADEFDDALGETWARPALTYWVGGYGAATGDTIDTNPTLKVVMGSGYWDLNSTAPENGRSLLLLDATTGNIEDQALLPALDTNYPLYDDTYYGALVDPAVGTHCISRYWGEAQETYIADPAGRLFRWDLGRTSAHAGDSGQVWGSNSDNAESVAQFIACQDDGTGTACAVGVAAKTDEDGVLVNSNDMAEPFLYPPAVVSADRIDPGDGLDDSVLEEEDQFLLALVSGSLMDDAIDGLNEDNDFHSSIYLLVDDHQSTPTGGFTIPSGTPTVTNSNDYAYYYRKSLAQFSRTRVFAPIPCTDPNACTSDADCTAPDTCAVNGFCGGVEAGCTDVTYTETANFSRSARPIRAPLITVSGVLDNTGEIDEQYEIYSVEYTVYEPGNRVCDPRFFDTNTGEWVTDSGSSYDITLALTADDEAGFNFQNGAGSQFGSDYGMTPGLDEVGVVQDTSCTSGNCLPNTGVPSTPACNPNDGTNAIADLAGTTVSWKELRGFSPYEK
jgi:hypothetical protein